MNIADHHGLPASSTIPPAQVLTNRSCVIISSTEPSSKRYSFARVMREKNFAGNQSRLVEWPAANREVVCHDSESQLPLNTFAREVADRPLRGNDVVAIVIHVRGGDYHAATKRVGKGVDGATDQLVRGKQGRIVKTLDLGKPAGAGADDHVGGAVTRISRQTALRTINGTPTFTPMKPTLR